MFICFSFLILPLVACAQPDTLWTRTLDSGGDDYATQILSTGDGGFALGGTASTTYTDFRLTRMDVDGNEVWAQSYGTARADWCLAMAASPAGGWLMGGHMTPPFALSDNIYLVRVDENGDTLWTRILGGAFGSESANAIWAMPDSSFYVAGDVDITQQGVMDCFVMHLDANGDTLWMRTYARPGRESAASLCLLADGNFLVGGSQVPPGEQWTGFYFMKITPEGDTLWTRRYGGIHDDTVSKVLPTADGGAVFTGTLSSFDPMGDIFLGKISGAGDSLWLQDYGGEGEDRGHSMAAAPGGGYLICGHSMWAGDPSGDGYLVRTDGEGNLLWWYNYGMPDVYESFETVDTTLDGGIILAGNRAGSPTADAFMVRLEHAERAETAPLVPAEFALLTNYPNPFNGSTTIPFRIEKAANVRLELCDLTGRRVRTLLAGYLEAGRHTVSLRGDDLASGTYICRLTIPGRSVARKIMLVK